MYIYINNQGKITTQIEHGEPVRQGNRLRLVVCFSLDNEIAMNAAGLSVKFRLVDNSEKWGIEYDFPNGHINKFDKLKSSEITYDLIPDKEYLMFENIFDVNEFTTLYNGQLQCVFILRNKNREAIEDYLQDRAEITVNRTYGYILPEIAITPEQYDIFLASIVSKLDKDNGVANNLAVNNGVYSGTQVFSNANVVIQDAKNDSNPTPLGQVKDILDKALVIEDFLSETSTNAVQNRTITEELGKKVDKENGKVLSDNNYTDAEKAKLADLKRYDAEVITLTNMINTVSEKNYEQDSIFRALYSNVESIDTDLEGVKNVNTTQGNEIDNLKTRLSSVENENALQEQDITNLNVRIDNIRERKVYQLELSSLTFNSLISNVNIQNVSNYDAIEIRLLNDVTNDYGTFHKGFYIFNQDHNGIRGGEHVCFSCIYASYYDTGAKDEFTLLNMECSINENGTATSIYLKANKVQHALKSGENIKTINGESILGSGDIKVGVSSDVETRIVNIESKNTTQDTEINNVKGRLSNVESKNTTQDTEINNVKTRVTNVENKNTSQDTEINNVKTRVTNVENELSSQDDMIKELDNLIIEVSGQLDSKAPLVSGKIPSDYLPSYVDDVLEYNSKSNFPSKGESGKIYIVTSDNKTYRWSGTTYVEISSSLALGETSSTAYAGDKGKVLADELTTAQQDISTLRGNVNTNKINIASHNNRLNDLETNKQDKLKSGTNIKTINGQSLLGSGNIQIEQSGGGSNAKHKIDYIRSMVGERNICDVIASFLQTNKAPAINNASDIQPICEFVTPIKLSVASKMFYRKTKYRGDEWDAPRVAINKEYNVLTIKDILELIGFYLFNDNDDTYVFGNDKEASNVLSFNWCNCWYPDFDGAQGTCFENGKASHLKGRSLMLDFINLTGSFEDFYVNDYTKLRMFVDSKLNFMNSNVPTIIKYNMKRAFIKRHFGTYAIDGRELGELTNGKDFNITECRPRWETLYLKPFITEDGGKQILGTHGICLKWCVAPISMRTDEPSFEMNGDAEWGQGEWQVGLFIKWDKFKIR